MTLRDHLNGLRDPKRLPNRASDRPVKVSGAYSQTLEIQGAPRTYQLAAARPGRIPRTATLVNGPSASVRIVGDLVFLDAREDGTATVEVIY